MVSWRNSAASCFNSWSLSERKSCGVWIPSSKGVGFSALIGTWLQWRGGCDGSTQSTFIDQRLSLQLPIRPKPRVIRMMAIDMTIAERPVPPKGRLSFPMLILRTIANPVASWGEDFYEEPAVLGWGCRLGETNSICLLMIVATKQDFALVPNVEGLGAGGLAVLVERDFLDARLCLAQQPVAMSLQRRASLVNEDRGFELDVALLEAIDDAFELFQSLLEAHGLDVGMVSLI